MNENVKNCKNVQGNGYDFKMIQLYPLGTEY